MAFMVGSSFVGLGCGATVRLTCVGQRSLLAVTLQLSHVGNVIKVENFSIMEIPSCFC